MAAFNPPMQLRKFFINDVGRLRSGWRLLLFVCVFIAVFFLVGLCLRLAYVLVHQFLPPVPHGAFIANIIYRLTLLFSALVAGYFCTRLLEGLPWRALGLTFHSGWFRDLLLGSVLGIASLALAAIIATAGGGLRFTISGTGIFLLVGKSLVSTAVLFIVAALAEEAMFRGYPLQTLIARKIDLARRVTDFRSVCQRPPVESKRGARCHVCQYGTGGCVACGRLSAHSKSLVSAGSSLGLELGPRLALWFAGQRPNSQRAIHCYREKTLARPG